MLLMMRMIIIQGKVSFSTINRFAESHFLHLYYFGRVSIDIVYSFIVDILFCPVAKFCLLFLIFHVCFHFAICTFLGFCVLVCISFMGIT